MENIKRSDLIELLCERAEHHPTSLAYAFLHDGEQDIEQWTYLELARQAKAVAALLQDAGAVGERVLLLYPPGLDFIAAFFGCLAAGAIAVPAYPPRNKRHLPRILTIIADAELIIRGRNLYPQDIELTVEQSAPSIRKNACAVFSVEMNEQEQAVIVAEVERRYHHQEQTHATNNHYDNDINDAEHIGFAGELYLSPDLGDAIRSVRQAVAEQHELQASAIVLIKAASIPRTLSGKIRRRACREAFLSHKLEVLAEWRTDALHLDPAALTQESHFFQLGGDSLSATTLTGRLSEALDAHILDRYLALLEQVAQSQDVLLSEMPLPSALIQQAERARFRQLATNYQYCSRQIPNHAAELLTIPTPMFEKLEHLAQDEGTTVPILLFTALNVLLYRYTGEEHILVGLPLVIPKSIPFDVSTDLPPDSIVLHTDLSGEQTFIELLSCIKYIIAEIQTREEFTFEQFFAEIHPDRDTLPSAQKTTLTQKTQLENAKQKGFNCSLTFTEKEYQLSGVIEYRSDVLEAETIKRMRNHFYRLLEEIIKSPAQQLIAFPILTDVERQQLLVDWNDTAIPYPLDVCLYRLIEAQVERTPDAIAVVFDDASLTYYELNRRANQLAHHLQAAGVAPDTLVGICAERSFEMIIGLLAVMKAGGAYVPLDPDYPPERLAFMTQDAQTPVLLTQEKFLATLPEHRAQVFCLDRDWPMLAKLSEANPTNSVTATDLIYTIYTSGSTGKPKGAMNIHRSVVNRLLWMQDAYQLTPDDRILQKTPFSFDVSGWEFWWPLLTGARLIFAKPGGHKDSRYLVQLIQTQQITTLHFVPSMLQVFLLETNVHDCRSLRRVICSGEALPFELQQRFFDVFPDVELHNLYGPTEAAIDVTFWRCDPVSTRKSVPIGRPIANTQLYVLDSAMQPVPIGVPGELYLGGVNIARGYWNRPDLTTERFVPNPFNPEFGARIYKTGDLVRYGSDGVVEYLGRLDHQVKLRGFRIELGEIETALANHPAIREVIVMAREDQPGEKRLVAYLTTNQRPAPTSQELRQQLQASLPEYMIPAAFVFLETMPLSPNGKIDRRALPAPEFTDQEAYVAPRTPTEKTLVTIWEELFGIERIGIHDNFFQIGGHSLLATQVLSRIIDAFHVDLSLGELLDRPTIAGVAEHLEMFHWVAQTQRHLQQTTEEREEGEL